jgi:DNA-binding NarL/FixJ family response regulator
LLSDREREILQWIALGHSRAGIAKTLNISAGTVHTHIKNIYTKLQAHNRTEAINRARDLGEL